MKIQLIYFEDDSAHHVKQMDNEDITLDEMIDELRVMLSEIGMKEVRENYDIKITF